MKNYVVRRHMKNSRTWLPVGYFETAAEALAEYEKLRQARHDERVWVVELDSGHVIADSHPRR